MRMGVGLIACALLGSVAATSAKAAEVDPSVYRPMERKNYPKTFAKWGAEGVKKIDRLRKDAAVFAAKSTECDKVETSELSEQRSSPPSQIVVFVDCSNGKRFYLSDADLRTAGQPASQESKMKSLTNEAAMEQCQSRVRSGLAFPSTMSVKWSGSNVYRAPTTGNVVATFNFDAKNALGNELPYQARCVFDDRGMHPPEISGR